jgi:hypothetical protein
MAKSKVTSDTRDPNATYGTSTNPTLRWNPPTWQGPNQDYTNAQNGIYGNLGGPGGFSGLMQRIEGMQPTSLLKGMYDTLGVTGKQAGSYVMGQLSGKNASARADRYRADEMARTNRDFSKSYAQQKTLASGKGLSGSSFDAMARAAGTGELASARNQVDLNSLNYEDTLRQAGFNRGMGALQLGTGLASQDAANQLSFGNMLTNAGGLDLSRWSTMLNALQNQQNMAQGQQFGENQFNQGNYNTVTNMQPKQNGFAQFLGQALPLASMFIPGAGAAGAAVKSAGGFNQFRNYTGSASGN